MESSSDILKQVRRIEIKTRGLSNDIFAGKYHSAFKARGMAFSEVREYLSTRYPVKALEMTSQEILDRMIRESLPEKSIKRLKDILITADFVKFAKFTPDADQNETVYTDAYYFIEETKAVEVEQPAVEIEPIKTEEKKEDDA